MVADSVARLLIRIFLMRHRYGEAAGWCESEQLDRSAGMRDIVRFKRL